MEREYEVQLHSKEGQVITISEKYEGTFYAVEDLKTLLAGIQPGQSVAIRRVH